MEKLPKKKRFSLKKFSNKTPVNRNLSRPQYDSNRVSEPRFSEQQVREIYTGTNWG